MPEPCLTCPTNTLWRPNPSDLWLENREIAYIDLNDDNLTFSYICFINHILLYKVNALGHLLGSIFWWLLVIISGVIRQLHPTEAILGVKIISDVCFGHICRYLKHDEHFHIWRTNTLTMTNQHKGGKVRQFCFFIFVLISQWLQTIQYLIPYPWAQTDLYNHNHT